LRPKAYDVLLYLVEHRGRVVSKDDSRRDAQLSLRYSF